MTNESQVAEQVTALTAMPGACGAPATFHDRSKRWAERVLGVGAPLFRARRAARGDTLIFAYHNIVPHGEAAAGEASLHLTQSAFAAQLDQLVATHDVVSLAQIMDVSSRATRPRAVITFDDAYHGAVTAGVHEVAQRGLSATIFVAPGFVPRGDFWWDAYADANGELAASFRAFALNELAGDDATVRNWATSKGHRPQMLPTHAMAAAEAELLAASRVEGITLASHTWSHCNLGAVPDDVAEEELTRPLEWLEARFRSVLRWLSYPYGLCNSRTAAIARRAGYIGALRIAGGWAHRSSEPFELPRLNIPSGLSMDGFRLRAAGLLK